MATLHCIANAVFETVGAAGPWPELRIFAQIDVDGQLARGTTAEVSGRDPGTSVLSANEYHSGDGLIRMVWLRKLAPPQGQGP